MTVYFLRDSRGADLNGYVAAGQDAWRGADLYAQSGFARNNTWPPFASFAMIPLAWSAKLLGRPWTKEWWYLFNFACLIGAILIWSRLLLRRRVSFLSRTGIDFTDARVYVPVLFVLPGIIHNFFLLQINACILFLLSLGFCLFTNRRLWAGGLCFGLAAALKAIPGLFLIYFLLRRQWRFGAWIALWGTVFTLSPILVYGPGGFLALGRKWLSISSAAHVVIGYEKAGNQSIYAATERLLAHQLGIVPAGSIMVAIVAGSIGLALLAGSILVFRRRGYEPGSPAAMLEFSSVCLLMVLLSPIAWRHYWVLAYPASAAVFIFLRDHPGRWRLGRVRYLMVGWIALLLIPFLAGGALGLWFRRMSSFTLSAILLNLLVLFLHGQADDPGESSPPPGVRLRSSGGAGGAPRAG